MTEVLAGRGSLPSASAEAVRGSLRQWITIPRLVAAAVFLFVLTIYSVAISPTTSFWDSGEFIACAYSLGLPHPPGTPLYIVIGRLFSLLPFSEKALGINFLSALSGALAILFLHLCVVRIVARWRQPGEGPQARMLVAQLSGVTASLFAAFGSTYWGNCIEAEVYAPSGFLVSFSTWLVLRWGDDPGRPGGRNLLLAVGYILALGIGYHLGTYLAAPCFLLYILAVEPKTLSDSRLWWWGLLLSLLGLSIHLFLPIRSRLNPAIDENNPQTWNNFWYYIGRRQYKPSSVFDRQAPWSFQFDHFWRYFSEQFPVSLSLLGLLGLAGHMRRDRKTFILMGSLFIVTGLALVIYMNFTATEVRERDYFYTMAFFFYAVWIGMGLGLGLEEILRALAARPALTKPVAGLAAAGMVALSTIPLATNFHTHDRRGDFNAYDYGYNMLAGLDKDGIIFTNGDNDTFPLWFQQEVKGFRRDVRVVNLSLLNTDWYIWQLKHIPPRVPIGIPDDQLPLLRPVRTKDNKVLYVRDIAMTDIINTAVATRTVYFAVTVPDLDKMGLMKNLLLEGIVFRLVKERKEELDLAKCEENMWHTYRYRGLLTADGRLDAQVHRDANTTSLVTNYSAAHIRMAMAYSRRGMYADAVRECERAGVISPTYYPYLSLMGPMYAESGDYLKAEEFLQKRIANDPNDPEPYFHLGYVYEEEGRTEESLVNYRKAVELDPNQVEAQRRLAGTLLRAGKTDDAVALLERWMSLHPEDTNTERVLGELKAALGKAPDTVPGRRP